VLHLSHDGFSAIFTGDCGVEGMEKALAYAEANGITYANPTYFQLSHHGSIKNISWKVLDLISPKKVFVSAPSDSNKHPSRLIVNYLTHVEGAKVFHVSTGTIRISHNAPAREGWNAVQPLSVFETVFLPIV